MDGLTGETINTQIVVAGEDAVAPEAPVHEGYTFVEWDTDFTNVQSDLTVTAVYAINEYTVTFVDGLTGETIDTQTVEHGADAVEPAVPEHVGSCLSYAKIVEIEDNTKQAGVFLQSKSRLPHLEIVQSAVWKSLTCGT